MVKGKKILVFSPVSKGWGTSATAIALSVMLEQEYEGKILLIDLFSEVSAMEQYLLNDMCKQPKYLPLEIFMKTFDAEKLLLFARPISESLYFIKVNCEKLNAEKDMRAKINKLITDSTEIFDLVVIRAEGKLAKEIESNWDVGVSISSFENGLEKTFASESSFNWYREMLKKGECLKVTNGVPNEWVVREGLRGYISGMEKGYSLPFNGDLMASGNIENRLYSKLREEMMANKSPYSKKVGKIVERVLEVTSLRGVRKGGKEAIGTN